jgi:hypothetical protein
LEHTLPFTKIIYHILHLRLRIEPNVANLIEKPLLKVEKIIKLYLIFMNFGRKKFMVRNDSKKKTLVFDCYNLIDPIEQGAVIF